MNYSLPIDICSKIRQMRFSFTLVFLVVSTQIFLCSARPNIDNFNHDGIQNRNVSPYSKNAGKPEHHKLIKRDGGVIKSQNELPSQTPANEDSLGTEDEIIEGADTESDYEYSLEDDEATRHTYTEPKFETNTFTSTSIPSTATKLAFEAEFALPETTTEVEIITTTALDTTSEIASEAESAVPETTTEVEIITTTTLDTTSETASEAESAVPETTTEVEIITTTTLDTTSETASEADSAVPKTTTGTAQGTSSEIPSKAESAVPETTTEVEIIPTTALDTASKIISEAESAKIETTTEVEFTQTPAPRTTITRTVPNTSTVKPNSMSTSLQAASIFVILIPVSLLL